MTTSRRFKCVPQILGSLRIHIFMLLFSLIIYAYQYLPKSWHATEERKLFDVGEICFFCKGVEIKPLGTKIMSA